MARPRRTGQTVDPITRAGGVGTYNDVYVQTGGGAKGRRAAREAIRRQFPEVGQDTLDAVERRADRARSGGRRIRQGNDPYKLPAEDHQEIPGPPGQQGERRTWRYYYLVQVHFEVTMGGRVVSTGVTDFEASGSSPLSKGDILAQAQALMNARVGLWDVEYEFQRRGASVRVTDVVIVQATRQLRPASAAGEE